MAIPAFVITAPTFSSVARFAGQTADPDAFLAAEISAAAELFIGEEGIVNAYLEAPDGREYLDRAKAALKPDEVELALANGGRLSVGDAVRFARTILPD